jgi:hypothetical protein
MALELASGGADSLRSEEQHTRRLHPYLLSLRDKEITQLLLRLDCHTSR